MSINPNNERTWSLKEVSDHPLVKMYGLTERQLRRAAQKGTIGYTRPGGLVIRFTHQNIVDFIEGSSNAPMNRGGSR